MAELAYDPNEPIRVEWVRDGRIRATRDVTLPAPGFTARSVVEYATRDGDATLIETTPSETPPVDANDPERTAFVVGSLVENATDATGNSLVERYIRLRRIGRRVLSTPGVPTFVRFDQTDLSVLDVPDTFLELSVHASMYDADNNAFRRPPSRRTDEWTDRFDELPVETVRLRQSA